LDTAKAVLREKFIPWVHILKCQKDLKSMTWCYISNS
jgi:hypothetical protein